VKAFRSRHVVTPEGIHSATILLDDGKISAVLPYETPLPNGILLEDFGDGAILPGLADVHVHCNEPGRTEWEGFETATRAAAAGGVTTLVDMPLNSSPVTTSRAAFAQKLAVAREPGKLSIDVGFWAGLVPGNASEIGPLLDAGALGAKAFLVHSGIDDFPAATEADLRAAMPILAAQNAPLLVHAELPLPEEVFYTPTDRRNYSEYLRSRPEDWELRAIRLLLDLCAEFRCPVHIVHLSTALALPLLRQARAAGLPVTVETGPHYLYFASETIPDADTRFKCAPPIRDTVNREQLWEGLRDGIIEMIGSDHSPCPPAMKGQEEGDFFRAWGGIASLQLELPLLWTGASARGFELTDIARWLSANPARLAGQYGRKGVITPGADADIIVFDPEAEFVVDAALLQHRHSITPYAGERLKGVVQRTYLRGHCIYDKGAFLQPPTGVPLLGRQ
jgi:allantoinase